MLTEVKKTIHIVVDDMDTVPDETMIQDALNQNVQAMVTPGEMAVLVFEERGEALLAAAKEKNLPEKSYRVWTVHMHFVRDCAFEPKPKEAKAKPEHPVCDFLPCGSKCPLDKEA